MIKRYTARALLISALVLISGCFSGSGNGSFGYQGRVYLHEKQIAPTGAYDNGYHAKNIYRYYPLSSIYYDIQKGLYYYQRDDKWVASVSIPAALSTDVGSFITIEMDTDKPYKRHNEVKKKFQLENFNN